MNEFLVIRLNSDPGLADWVVVDQVGAIVAGPFNGRLADAATTSAGRRVIALVPARDVLRTNIRIPLSNRSKLRQILPFALEDLLAEDIESLHFASGQRSSAGDVPVAVVRNEKVAEWKDRCLSAGIELTALYADSDAIGDMPSTSTLLIENSGSAPCALLRDPDGETSVIDFPELESMLDLWLSRRHRSGDGEETQVPINLQVYCANQIGEELNSLWDKLRAATDMLDIKLLSGGSLPHLARHIVTGPGINLLQGKFARRSNFSAYWPAWRVAASLLVALAVVSIGINVAELRAMNQQAARLDVEIEAAFRYAFPGVNTIRDPRAQMESLLRARGQATGQSTDIPFLNTLQAVAKAVTSQKDATLDSLNFRSGLMELRLQVPGVETLDRIQQQVSEESGLAADIQSASASGNQVDGRIRIKRPSQ